MPSSIEVNGLGKRYRLGVDATGYDTLRGALLRGVRSSSRDAAGVWALRDVSFAVEQGEALGIIGRNGAGKTTLLKVLARITDPTLGEARTRGRVGALLDVGTGFHPELTGRENIFLSGAILGMRRAAVRRRFDEIVEFAGIERFLETPVKRYSDGMRLRLAFAVAAHIEPPIVVVDEVLAVGDAAFREKCLGKMSDSGRHGRTVLFVSHDLGAVDRLCSRSIWIDAGRIREEGPSSKVINAYLKSGARPSARFEVPDQPDQPAQVSSVAVTDWQGNPADAPQRDQPLAITAQIEVRDPITDLDQGFWVTNSTGVIVISERRFDHAEDPTTLGRPGKRLILLKLPSLLPPGDYTVGAWLGTELETFFMQDVLRFELLALSDDREEALTRRRAVQPEVAWETRELTP